MAGRKMWLIFLGLSLACTALDLSKQYPPQGYLGVGLDFPMALSSGEWNPEERFSKRRNFVFNSHIVLENEALKLSPGQQAQMALDAFNEMGKELNRYDITSQKSIPGVMLALLFDNEIILSSSQKGPAQFMTDFGDPRLREDLLRCQATFRETYNKDERHKNNYGCGEVMGAQSLAQFRPDEDLSKIKARMVSVASPKGATGPKVIQPCPDKDTTRWGCREFVKKLNWEVIPDDVQLEPYKDTLEKLGVKRKVVPSVISCQ